MGKHRGSAWPVHSQDSVFVQKFQGAAAPPFSTQNGGRLVSAEAAPEISIPPEICVPTEGPPHQCTRWEPWAGLHCTKSGEKLLIKSPSPEDSLCLIRLLISQGGGFVMRQQHLYCVFELNVPLRQPNNALFTAERERESQRESQALTLESLGLVASSTCSYQRFRMLKVKQ